MAVYEKTVKKDIATLISKAKSFFGPDGVGLELKSEEECCLSFEGGGGYVSVALSNEEDKTKTSVEVETREWDYQARQFLNSL